MMKQAWLISISDHFKLQIIIELNDSIYFGVSFVLIREVAWVSGYVRQMEQSFE